MKRNGFCLLAVLLLGALALAACAPAASGPASGGKEPIKIGMVLSETGSLASLGGTIARAVRLEVDRINTKGGVDGRPIALVAYDDQSKSDESIALLQKLAKEDKVPAILGPAAGVVIGPALPVLRELKVPTYGFGAVVLAPEDKYFFTNITSVNSLMTTYFEYIKKRGWKKIAGLHPQDDTSQQFAKFIETNASKFGFEVVGQERMGQTDTDVTPQLTKLKALNPDVLFAMGSGDPAVLTYKNARQIGFQAPIILNAAASSSQWFKLSGEIPQEGLVYTVGSKLQAVDVLPDTDPAKKDALDFRQAFRAKYDGLTPELTEASGWDTLHDLVGALKSVGTDREKIRTYLETSKFCGIGACYNKTASDHQGLDYSSVFVMTAKGTTWVASK